MKTGTGQFGRFWDEDWEREENDFIYGYLGGYSQANSKYLAADGAGWKHFEPAEIPPRWPSRRRVIADRAKLCQVLLDMGFRPNGEGNFVSEDHDESFIYRMWSQCGKDVDCDGYDEQEWHYLSEWTEEY